MFSFNGFQSPNDMMKHITFKTYHMKSDMMKHLK